MKGRSETGAHVKHIEPEASGRGKGLPPGGRGRGEPGSGKTRMTEEGEPP